MMKLFRSALCSKVMHSVADHGNMWNRLNRLRLVPLVFPPTMRTSLSIQGASQKDPNLPPPDPKLLKNC